jgi:hypothetical protein
MIVLCVIVFRFSDRKREYFKLKDGDHFPYLPKELQLASESPYQVYKIADTSRKWANLIHRFRENEACN